MSAQITFSDLWTYEVGDSEVRLPLNRLGERATHVHGELRIVINDRALPSLGYWGPDDVCIGQWVQELRLMVANLAVPNAVHVFDEGEQGQPAYAFRRRGDDAEVSVVDSELGDGLGDPNWGVPVCRYEELAAAVDRFLNDLQTQVCRLAPETGESWWKAIAGA